MDPGTFVDRSREMRALDKLPRAGGGLAVIYGRRRIGKTRLIREWMSRLEGYINVYFQAGLWGHKQNLEDLARALARGLGVPELAVEHASLRSLLGLAYRLSGGRLVLAIDELGYWIRSSGPGILSDIQYIVDHVIPTTGGIIVLTGSSITLMSSRVAGEGSPLYGRAMVRLRMGGLGYGCVSRFAPNLEPQGLVELYSLVGGIPHYLTLYNGGAPREWFRSAFGPGGMLEDEPYMILREEFREASPYVSLLREASHGPSTMGKIASRAGIPLSHASKYLLTLEQVGLARRIPILPGSRRSLWITSDRLLRSWLLLSTTGWSSEALARVISMGWEEIALQDAMHRFVSKGYTVTRWGRLLRKGLEVDWVLLDDDKKFGLVIEAKTSIGSPDRVARKAREAAEGLLEDYTFEVLVYSLQGGGDVGAEDLAFPC